MTAANMDTNNMETDADAEEDDRPITKLRDNDVLCGRGSGPNERAGNINFRDLVSTRKAEYMAVHPRDHTNKNRIAKEVVEVVRSRGGRFLKRVAHGRDEDGRETYELADEPTVLEKAKQALRQNKRGPAEMSGLYPYSGEQQQQQQQQGESGPSSRPSSSGPQHQPGAAGQSPAPTPTIPAQTADPYEAFMSHMQQSQQRYGAYGYGMSPSEAVEASARQREIQIQQYVARQQQNPYRDSYAAAPDPARMAAASMLDLDPYRARRLRQLEHLESGRSMPAAPRLRQLEQLDPGSMPATPYDDLSVRARQLDSRARQLELEQLDPSARQLEQLEQLDPSARRLEQSRARQLELDARARQLDSQRRELDSQYMSNYLEQQALTHEAAAAAHAAAAASVRRANLVTQAAGRDIDSASGHSDAMSRGSDPMSDSRMRALESLFVGATSQAGSAAPRAPPLYGGASRGSGRSAGDSFIDGLEDMSLPSGSIGEISDLTPGGTSVAGRSRRSDLSGVSALSRHSDFSGLSIQRSVRRGYGGTIMETSEKDSASSSSDSMSWAYGGRFRAHPNAALLGSSFLSSDRGHSGSTDRHVSFLESEDHSLPGSLGDHSMADANRASAQYAAGARHALPEARSVPKRARGSLSAYYREMKQSGDGGSLADGGWMDT